MVFTRRSYEEESENSEKKNPKEGIKRKIIKIVNYFLHNKKEKKT